MIEIFAFDAFKILWLKFALTIASLTYWVVATKLLVAIYCGTVGALHVPWQTNPDTCI